MAVIRSRIQRPNGGGNDRGISASRSFSKTRGVARNLSLKGSRLLQRQRSPQHRCSCIGVVAVFLALVVLVVMATMQHSIRGGVASAAGAVLRHRNVQKLEQTQQAQDVEAKAEEPKLRRHLKQDELSSSEDSKAQDDDKVGKEEEHVMDHIEAPRDNSIEEPPAITTSEAKNEEEILVEEIEEEIKEEEEEQGVVKGEKEVREEAERLVKAEEALEEAHPSEQQQHQSADEEPEYHEPPKPSIRFCDYLHVKSGRSMVESSSHDSAMEGGIGFNNPAVIVLGMEDTSTELVWHVISQILHPNVKSHRTFQLMTHATAVDYDALGKSDPNVHTDFWSNISLKSEGRWFPHVLCQQETHGLGAGFPWVAASPDIVSRNVKAQDTLKMVNSLPKGAVKVIRVRRNYLDALIRQTKLAQQNQEEQHTHGEDAVMLDYKTALTTMRHMKVEQTAIDNFLEENQIPHLTLDFEALFPFDHWTNMVQTAQAAQSSPVFLHTHTVATPSKVERSWRDLVEFLGVTRPLTLFDVLQYAMRTHKVTAFWIQKDTVHEYARLQLLIRGTAFYNQLRHLETNIQDWRQGDEM